MPNWDPPTCLFCGKETNGEAMHSLCQVCLARVPHAERASVILASAVVPAAASLRREPMRRANPELLARALLALREYVLSDEGPAPEVQDRPKYLTSSTPHDGDKP